MHAHVRTYEYASAYSYKLLFVSYRQDVGEIDCKPAAGHYTGAGDELDVEDLYTKYKVL